MHPIAPAPPAVDDAAAPRLVLRDGTVASVRRSTPADREAMRRFFHELSPESRRKRFFTAGEPPDVLVDRMCDSADQQRSVTLVAERQVGNDVRLIAVGSYFATGPGIAEAAFAVDDRFHGKGLATDLLERLAAIAAGDGFRRFEATALTDNLAMLEVFRDSGFEVRSKSPGRHRRVDPRPHARRRKASSRPKTRHRRATAASLRPMLEPRAVAMVGASRDPDSIGRRILDAIVDAGFQGPVYPVNPAAGGSRRPARLRQRARGSGRRRPRHRRGAARAGAGRGGRLRRGRRQVARRHHRGLRREPATKDERGSRQLVERVRGYGMRMVGPNCMGLLNANAAVRLNASFSPIFPLTGRVGLSSQSGALGLAILALASGRGVGLSTFVSVGNKADVSSNDLLEYWEEDDATRIVLLYLESFGNPRRFARLARRIGRTKPIVAVKAGRSHAGSRAAGSHTAALAANDTAVEALFHQTGVIRADTIDEMFDIAACLDAQPLPPGRRVAIVTNAGGPGILAVDACEAVGPVRAAVLGGDARSGLRAFLPGGRQHRQPSRHGRVRRAGLNIARRSRSPSPTRTPTR